VSITGTLGQVNAALNTLNYSNSSAGTDTITVTTSDLIDHSSALKSIAVTINPASTPPQLSLPSGPSVPTLTLGSRF
jgi:hypothetical protein